MHSIRLIRLAPLAAAALLALMTQAQFAPGGMGGPGRGQGGGLFGVTRRTSMGVPNAVAARYFQASGLPLVNPRVPGQSDPAGGAYLAANGAGAAAPQSRPPTCPALGLAQQSRRPAPPSPDPPPSYARRGLARAGR